MKRFIILSFAVLGWGFYELSGGSDFEPGWYIAPEDRVAKAEPEDTPDIVARADTSGAELVSVAQAAVRPEPEADVQPDVETTVMQEPEASGVSDLAQIEPVTPEVDPEKLAAVVAAALDEAETVDAAPEPFFNTEPVFPVLQTEPVIQTEQVFQDVREVTGTRVNLRGGPGTGYPVLTSLSQGDPVIVIGDTGDGWLQLQVYDSGRVGWIADFLVTAEIE